MQYFNAAFFLFSIRLNKRHFLIEFRYHLDAACECGKGGYSKERPDLEGSRIWDKSLVWNFFIKAVYENEAFSTFSSNLSVLLVLNQPDEVEIDFQSAKTSPFPDSPSKSCLPSVFQNFTLQKLSISKSYIQKRFKKRLLCLFS